MRTRLLLVFAVLAVFTTMIFAVPLAFERAQSRTQELVLSRSADVRRFADLAGEEPGTGRATNLRGEMEAYTSLYGEPVIIVSASDTEVLNTGVDRTREEVRHALSNAIRNQPAPRLEALTPFSAQTLLVAQPIGADSQVSGAVLIEVSTASAIGDITRTWLLVAAGAILGLLVFGGIAQMLSRWILRPLSQMDRRIQRMRDSLPFITGAEDGKNEQARAAGPPELQTVSHTLDSMNSALQASTEAQRRLIADTAHQLRNPMAALQLRLDVIQATQTPDQHDSVVQAQHEGERLNAILDDLLRLARAESLTLTPQENAPCDLLEVAGERIGNWRPLVERGGGSIALVGGPAPVMARARVLLLEQYLDIMLDNAAKYATGSQVKVTVAEHIDGAEIVVADHGHGVEEDQLGRLTERFYRDAASADRSGTATRGSGLGLAIAQALAQGMGATLSFSQTVPHGLSATLRFTTPTPHGTNERENR
jgi:signal transduction histidine kinase